MAKTIYFMKKIRAFHLSVFLFLSISAIAQTDTVIRYTYSTQTIDTLLIPPFSSSISAAHTAAFFGTSINKVPLATSTPSANLFPGTSFTRLAKVDAFFSPSAYPVSTTVKISSYNNATLSLICTGNMVSSNMVLSAAHCVSNFGFKQFKSYDSTVVFPGFHNGLPNSNLPKAKVNRVYIFKTYYNGESWEDITLLELDTPIGFQTGWIGIGFDTIDTAFNAPTFHKFSYPAIRNPFDTTEVYNGDTLYYNYGNISNLSNVFLGVSGGSIYGIPGQSGSSFIYTDNQNEYYSVGVFSFSSSYLHYRINAKIFQAFKKLLNDNAVGLIENSTVPTQVNAFPNPFTETLHFDTPKAYIISITLVNALGQVVFQEDFKTKISQRSIQPLQLPTGVYTYRVYLSNHTFIHGKVMKG